MDHLAAVGAGEPRAMAADYAPDAVLMRPDAGHVGAAAIAEYFKTVPGRLGGGEVRFEAPLANSDGSVSVRWRIHGGPAAGASGCDTFAVSRGLICHQDVALDRADF